MDPSNIGYGALNTSDQQGLVEGSVPMNTPNEWMSINGHYNNHTNYQNSSNQPSKIIQPPAFQDEISQRQVYATPQESYNVAPRPNMQHAMSPAMMNDEYNGYGQSRNRMNYPKADYMPMPQSAGPEYFQSSTPQNQSNQSTYQYSSPGNNPQIQSPYQTVHFPVPPNQYQSNLNQNYYSTPDVAMFYQNQGQQTNAPHLQPRNRQQVLNYNQNPVMEDDPAALTAQYNATPPPQMPQMQGNYDETMNNFHQPQPPYPQAHPMYRPHYRMRPQYPQPNNYNNPVNSNALRQDLPLKQTYQQHQLQRQQHAMSPASNPSYQPQPQSQSQQYNYKLPESPRFDMAQTNYSHPSTMDNQLKYQHQVAPTRPTNSSMKPEPGTQTKAPGKARRGPAKKASQSPQVANNDANIRQNHQKSVISFLIRINTILLSTLIKYQSAQNTPAAANYSQILPQEYLARLHTNLSFLLARSYNARSPTFLIVTAPSGSPELEQNYEILRSLLRPLNNINPND